MKIRKIPTFKRNVLQRRIKKADSWRKPKGLFNKIKDKSKSKGSIPKIGYGQNKKVKNLIPSYSFTKKQGEKTKITNFNSRSLRLIKIIVNMTQLKKIKTETGECIRIGKNVSRRSKEQFVIYCTENKITIDPYQLNNMKTTKK
jgi:ribosomal protein L32E